MWKYQNKVIRPGQGWTDVYGVQHPGNWIRWSAAEKAAKGLVEIIEQTPPDDRFYYWSRNADGSVTSTTKEIEDQTVVDAEGYPVIDPKTGQQLVQKGIKSNLIEQVKIQQGQLLSSTDWAYIRKQDTNMDIPEAIQLYRNSVRLTAALMEDAINQAKSIEDIEALFVKYSTNENDVMTKTGLLYDWPTM